MINVAIQIVNYKTKKYLPNCIESIINSLKDSAISYKILILDNNSGDNLEDMEEKYKDKSVEFCYSPKNLGFGAGQNLLSKKLDSKYLLALNPDTEVENSAIQIMFDFMESHPEAGMCGPRILLPEKNLFFGKLIFWPKKFIGKEFFERFLKIKILKKLKYLEHSPIVGSALFVRRKAFEEIGGFDENLFLYFEEGDLANSLKKLGYKIFFIYDSAVIHFYGKSDVLKSEKVKYFKNSRRYFCEKWYGRERARRILARERFYLRDRILEKFL